MCFHGDLRRLFLPTSAGHCRRLLSIAIDCRPIAVSVAVDCRIKYYQVLGTEYLVPSSWYQVLGTKYLVPSTCYQVLGTKYLVPSTWCQVLGTKCLVLDRGSKFLDLEACRKEFADRLPQGLPLTAYLEL